MKFGKELWLNLFEEYISPNLFAVQGGPIGTIKGSTDASLHGGSNETIGGFGRHRRPEIV